MTVLVTAGLMAILIFWHILYPGRAFNAVAWNDLSQIDRDVRQPMVDRMIAWDSLKRITQQEVKHLLGEPIKTKLPGWDLRFCALTPNAPNFETWPCAIDSRLTAR
jgi:hypothetical protein